MMISSAARSSHVAYRWILDISMGLSARQTLLALQILFSGLAMAAPPPPFAAGFRSIAVAAPVAGAQETTVALFYPTVSPARDIPMGPFTVHAAMQGKPAARVKGLILLSHGTGGSEIGHASLAEGLARAGYLVAALRHPGDNWQDGSLLQISAARYFDERPRQVSRVLDALLKDPEWKDRIASDAKGLRIGAVGHSAGGYTVLALAGGQPDLSRLTAHCADDRAEDPIFCSMGKPGTAGPQAPPPAEATALRDPRIRAVVALSPVGVVFTAQSLRQIAIPAALFVAQRDRFLVPRFHGEWIKANMPGAEFHWVSNAWHFAFMDTPSMAIPTPDGDIAADPQGFDRAAFLRELGEDLPRFFDRAFSTVGAR